MSDWETVIGLEVHVQLASETKIFCSCPVGWGGEPNTRVCPVCLGLPGVLPVFNEKVLELAIAAALSLGCSVGGVSAFARKNYYYPDLPKNFQISQFDRPIGRSGQLEFPTGEGVKKAGITRAHLEEDAGKLVHFAEQGFSGVDYNRTGVPLLEIVSEPDLRSPQEAYDYLKALKAVLRYAGVSECDMEKGSFRCDANVSIRPAGDPKLGVKVEIKNLNSFRGVERALAYEAERQRKALERGERIVQETRLYDAGSQQTFSMRTKEEAHDYRYFPEPDLVPLVLEKERVEAIRRSLPESPAALKKRFMGHEDGYGIDGYDAGVLTSEPEMAKYYEKTCALYKGRNYKMICNWITVELRALLNEENIPIEYSPVIPEQIAMLVEMIENNTISGKIGKVLLKSVFDLAKDFVKERLKEGEELRQEIQEAIRRNIMKQEDLSTLVKKKGFEQISNSSEIEAIVDRAIAAHPGPVAEFKAGKGKALGFLVGQVLKETEGKGNPRLINELLRKKLGA